MIFVAIFVPEGLLRKNCLHASNSTFETKFDFYFMT